MLDIHAIERSDMMGPYPEQDPWSTSSDEVVLQGMMGFVDLCKVTRVR